MSDDNRAIADERNSGDQWLKRLIDFWVEFEDKKAAMAAIETEVRNAFSNNTLPTGLAFFIYDPYDGVPEGPEVPFVNVAAFGCLELEYDEQRSTVAARAIAKSLGARVVIITYVQNDIDVGPIELWLRVEDLDVGAYTRIADVSVNGSGEVSVGGFTTERGGTSDILIARSQRQKS